MKEIIESALARVSGGSMKTTVARLQLRVIARGPGIILDEGLERELVAENVVRRKLSIGGTPLYVPNGPDAQVALANA
jgi:hypothetical protein